jgi:threonine dehydratase
MIGIGEVRAAARRLAGVAVRTPVLRADAIDAAIGARVVFKCENLQRMGAFKFRGAWNAISRLDDDARRRGVVAFTSGNHGLAVARAAQLQGASAVIVMPADAPAPKIDGARACGATVVTFDRMTSDRAAIARGYVEREGRTLIPPFDHDDVIAGQGTAALELMEDNVGHDALDALVVCVGGGGFLAGCTVAAKALRPTIHMVGAEPAAGNDAEQSLREGRIVELPEVPRTICDGQQTKSIGQRPFEILRAHGCEVMSVADDVVVQAMKMTFDHLKLVVEPSGACALAVVMAHREQFAGQRVGVTLSGGNVELARLAGLIGGVAPA